VTVYSQPNAAKLAHVKERPLVSLNLDSNGNGGGVVGIGGTATIDAVDVDPREDGPYWAKYEQDAAKFGLTEPMGGYSTRLKISVDKVWTTPTG
jgi:PPOX class probable F420-dependent enzyme